MDDYSMKLDPETNMCCTMYLYTNVTNTAEILKKVISGELQCCVLKVALIVDPFQVVVAANKAALNAKSVRLTTKSMYTETLFCLSMSKNISRSLVEFGISDKDKNILVVLLHNNDEPSTMQNLANVIKGDKIPTARLKEFTNIGLVKKTYKIEKDETNISSFIDSIVSRISIKDFASLK